jgi:autotransporter-associated beta strand protein
LIPRRYKPSAKFVPGIAGTGTFTQSGGININIFFADTVGYLFIGQEQGSSGSYNLSGSGLLSANIENVGYGGTGTFTQSGGTNTATTLYLGSSPSSSYNLSGSGVLSGAAEYVGSSGSGTFNQSGGTNEVSSYFMVGSLGTYNLTGGALLVPGIQGTGTFNLGGGMLVASAGFTTGQHMTLTASGGNGSIDTGAYSVTLTGVLSGPGGLNKLGAGVLTLTASDTYTGGTTISAGTFASRQRQYNRQHHRQYHEQRRAGVRPGKQHYFLR